MRNFAPRVTGIFGATAAAFATVLLASPAQAAGPDFDALSDVDAAGKPVVHQVKPGEIVPATIGVANVTDAPIQGAVVNIRSVNDSDLLDGFGNCAYYTNSNLDGAWCEFDTELAPGATYALSGDFISVTDQPTYKASTVNFRWYSRAYAAEHNGIDGLAKSASGSATQPHRGSGAPITLTPRDLVRREEPAFLNFVYLTVAAPPSSPSASASAPSSPTPPSPAGPTPSSSSTTPTPAATPTDTSGTGGGLPVTGTNTTLVAVAGAALLLAGAVGYAVARRRRTRFIA